jgi:hypothetical protein
MIEKSTLRAQLKRAWQNTIKDKYLTQQINSEHGLQAHLCAALLAQFNDSNMSGRRRVFVEPSLRLPDGSVRFPDIVICDSNHVVGIVELKYTPRGRPYRLDLVKDMETLTLALKYSNDLRIFNERFLGKLVKKHEYPLAANAVLCWAGVYAGSKLDLVSADSDQEFGKRFLQLNALTRKDLDPTF